MSDSECHDLDEQALVYEEEEVLWAKIRGYPWWPAFVDKVHGANNQQVDEIEYTVFFFGDNTHSRLEASKLRRFLDYYTEFFPKAKTNRKLYLSIMKAEEKLKQNGGNVEIFQTLRNSMKKLKKGKGHHKTQSRISSQDHANNMNSELPELMRHKTYPQQKIQNQNVSQQQQQSIQIEKPQPRKRGRKPKKDIQKEEQKQQKKIQQKQSQSQKNQKQQLSVSQDIEQLTKQGYRTRSRRGRRQINYKPDQSKQQKLDQQHQNQQSSSSEVQQEEKKVFVAKLPQKVKFISRNNVPKKRGRPKKIIEQQNVSSSLEQESNQIVNQASQNQNEQKQQQGQIKPTRDRPTLQNRKSRSQKVYLPRMEAKQANIRQRENLIAQNKQQSQTSEITKTLILERVKFCLNKRQQLIEYLDSLAISTDIVKQILDLDVTTVILEEGDSTTQSIRVLNKLKSSILHKYFPDDIKIKKKYDKITKKSQSRTTSVQNEQTLQDLQLRRKTIIKLQKILKNLNSQSGQKDKAVSIELFFRKHDESIGINYKTMAYKVLRSLKDKNHSTDEILSKLQAGQFDEEVK